MDEAQAHEAGRLLAITKTTDVVDAVVATIAIRTNGVVLTSDPEDLSRLVHASGREVGIVSI
jgi:predicted nucleic acid-binding protein